jgi:Icc-related predicted phosphoesterase
MRLGWVTDVHLNFVSPQKRLALYAQLRGVKLDGLLLGGDVGEADSVTSFLAEIADELRIPIYFVLGNHDFYHSAIAGVREKVAQETSASSWLHWLTTSGVIRLTPDTALIGHDSWADGRLGDFFCSEVLLNDYLLIGELSGLDKHERCRKLNALGDEAAGFIENRLLEALARYKNVLVLTHVPPFRESCWHEGQISNDDYLPHFACRAVGDRLAAIMRVHPDHTLIVLCGHTHSSGVARILDNLEVRTGGAEYGKPALQDVLEIG